MIVWQPFQEEIIDAQRLCRIIFHENMWKRESSHIGYATRGDKLRYEIHIANDHPHEDVKQLIMIHECGHIALGHMDVDTCDELPKIRKLFKEHEVPFENVSYYGGPNGFLNVAMDIEVNSKVLSVNNVSYMDSHAFVDNAIGLNTDSERGIWVPSRIGCDCKQTFRDYYVPMIEAIKENMQAAANGELQAYALGGPMNNDLNNPANSSDFTGELSKELNREQYKTRKSNRDISHESNVGEVIRRSHKSNGVGSGEDPQGTVSPEEGHRKAAISNFIRKIVSITPDYNRKSDRIRLYNRNCRTGNILYNSFRRKHQNNITNKFCFVLDVSGSMEVNMLSSALRTVKDCIADNAPDSVLVACGSKVEAVYPIKQIPSKVEYGYGTDMSEGLAWAIKNGFSDCVIFSDMDTNISSMVSLAKQNKINLYTIITGKPDNSLRDYLTFNKSHLYI